MSQQPTVNGAPKPSVLAPAVVGSWPYLRIAAETFNDFQQARISSKNRAERGGIPPEVIAPMLAEAEETEKRLAKELRKEYRRSVPEPMRAWQERQVGLGEHTFARLLGHLGHPRYANPMHWENGLAIQKANSKGGVPDRSPEGAAILVTEPIPEASRPHKRVLVPDLPYERSISQLWSYCGVGDPERKRKRGMSQDEALSAGSPRLRSLLFVISEGCVKNRRSPYRVVYEAARATYSNRLHADACVRCGPTGRPAPVGSPWSAAHQHAAAMRKVAKEILRDLWIAAGEEPGHVSNETHDTVARSRQEAA